MSHISMHDTSRVELYADAPPYFSDPAPASPIPALAGPVGGAVVIGYTRAAAIVEEGVAEGGKIGGVLPSGLWVGRGGVSS